MKIRPLQDWVRVRRDEPEEMTSGGIIIPQSAKDKPAKGIVEAVGPGGYKKEHEKEEKTFVPTVLKPGQRVIFRDYAARDFEIDGEKITLVREEDVLGTIEGSSGVPSLKKQHEIQAKKDQPLQVKEKTSGKSEKPKAESAAKKEAGEKTTKKTGAKTQKKG